MSKLYQLSSISALISGKLKGIKNISDLKQHGDFGIGTFEGFDGEMIAVDGEFYKLNTNGSIEIADDNETVPFASLTFFEPKFRFEIKNENFNNTQELILKIINQNFSIVPWAIKITGDFEEIKLRIAQKQIPPYKSLFESKKFQTVFNFDYTTGIIVGIFTPQYLNTIGVEGFHYHIINDSKSIGGHLFETKIKNAIIELQPLQKIELNIGDESFSQENIQNHIKILEN